MLKWIYIGFGICFYMGRIYEAERQDRLRARGTTYIITKSRSRNRSKRR